MNYLIVGLCLVGTCAFVALLLIDAAKSKRHASFTEPGTMEFVLSGERPIRTLVNVEGYYFHQGNGGFEIDVADISDSEFDEISLPKTANEEPDVLRLPKMSVRPMSVPVIDAILPINPPLNQEWFGKQTEEVRDKIALEREERRKKYSPGILEGRFGFYWVSLIYPYRRLHRFDEIPRIKLRESTSLTGSRSEGEAAAEVIVTEDPLLNATGFLWQFPRPIIVKGVEFADFFQADIVVQSILQVIMPYRPVFVYQPDNMFANLSATIRSAIVDFCRSMTMRQFVRFIKSGYGDEKFYLRVFSKLNAHTDKAPRGTIEEFGVWIRNAWVQDIIPIKEAEDVLKALRAKEVAVRQGEARLAQASFERRARIEEGQGRADALKAQFDAVGGSEAILQAQLGVDRISALKESSITTYVEGGAPSLVTVPARSDTPPQNPPRST